MKTVTTIPQYFLKSILQYAGVGLFCLCFLSLGISFLLAREQMSTDLRESAVAAAQAFHDRIFEGDIKSVEPQIRLVLKIHDGESAQILKSDLSRASDTFAPVEAVKPCPVMGATCFDGYFGQARVFVPISFSRDGGSPDRYLYISKRFHLNWGYLATVFAVFTLGYLGLLIAFLRISKLASTKIGGEILTWSDRLKANAKDASPIVVPPFTELMPLREALDGLNVQIEKFEKKATDKARLLLLRGIAHDLLSPVSRLQLYIGTLEGELTREKHSDTLDEIRDALTLVTGVASQVKTLNDLDAPVEETELIAATQQEVRLLGSSKTVAAKGIKLEFSSKVPTLLSPFSRTEISRILSNLIQNAADASANGSVVSIEVGRNQGNAFLAVKDSGCGIPENARGRVFDPDFTLKPGTGTGLGLAIVKYICERRSADIGLESQVNAGTTVTIRLPELGGVHA